MLIFGASVGDWKEKAAYALSKADNDFAEIRDIRCEGIDDAHTALALMAAYAAGTKCKNFLYHATINLNPAERLTKEQWIKSVDSLEKRLGLEGHYRIAFEHIKKDRQHYHIYWFRLPPGADGPAVNMGNNYFIHEKVAKELEQEFGLKQARRRSPDKPSRKKKEIHSRNSSVRVKPEVVTQEVTKIFKDSGTSEEFVTNLTKSGYILCRGKNRSLVLVDKQGGYHGLLRRLEGVRIADVRRKFPALEKTPLPLLGTVLKSHRVSGRQGFEKARRSFAVPSRKRTVRSPPSGTRAMFYRPLISLAALEARSLRKYSDERSKKYYPLPFMRKRKQKIILNEPSRPVVDLKAIENAELLAWAWENGRYDILASFGIYLAPGYFEP